MPVFQLPEKVSFPPVGLSEPDGLLALGGELSPEWLLAAYSQGIFPWFSEGEPILWWSPNPRMVLFASELKISKSMRSILRSGKFRITLDQDFKSVIDQCKTAPREGQNGTWITEEMKAAYLKLHELGYAHSVEVWEKDDLVGGLYGVSLGNCFFGESMFSRVNNASKAGFISLVKTLETKGFRLIDCQVYTPHLESLGAREIPREEFLEHLKQGLGYPGLKGKWDRFFQIEELAF